MHLSLTYRIFTLFNARERGAAEPRGIQVLPRSHRLFSIVRQARKMYDTSTAWFSADSACGIPMQGSEMLSEIRNQLNKKYFKKSSKIYILQEYKRNGNARPVNDVQSRDSSETVCADAGSNDFTNQVNLGFLNMLSI